MESVVSINPQSVIDKDISGDKLAQQAHIQRRQSPGDHGTNLNIVQTGGFLLFKPAQTTSFSFLLSHFMTGR